MSLACLLFPKPSQLAVSHLKQRMQLTGSCTTPYQGNAATVLRKDLGFSLKSPRISDVDGAPLHCPDSPDDLLSGGSFFPPRWFTCSLFVCLFIALQSACHLPVSIEDCGSLKGNVPLNPLRLLLSTVFESVPLIALESPSRLNHASPGYFLILAWPFLY